MTGGVIYASDTSATRLTMRAQGIANDLPCHVCHASSIRMLITNLTQQMCASTSIFFGGGGGSLVANMYLQSSFRHAASS